MPLFAVLGIPAKAASGREVITAEQIAAAISDAGLQIRPPASLC